ncbi:MAG: hypothetical protein WC346_11670 [Methanogenium sp.]|jgi:hypothetical protein
MKTITRDYQVYSFAELSKEAKEKAYKDNRYWNVDGIEWWDFICEDFIERMKCLGYIIRDKDIEFAGFWSQGDGACFEAEIDFKLWIKTFPKLEQKLNKVDLDEIHAIIGRNPHHYSHEMCMFGETTYEGEKNIDEVLNEIEEELTNDSRNEAKKLYKMLKESYDELTSDESIGESLEANEYEFLEDGSRFH